MTLEYFNLGHFYYLGFTIVLMVVLVLLLRKKNDKVVNIVILSLMILNVIQHIFKQEFYRIFDKDFTSSLYQRTFYNFCACLIMLSPLVYISKSNLLKNALFYLGFGSGLLALIMVGDYTGYPIFSTMVVRYFLCHILLLTTSTLPVFLGRVKLRIKNSFLVPLFIYLIMGITIVNNVIMVGSGNYKITYKEFFKSCDGIGGTIANAKPYNIYEISFDNNSNNYYFEVNCETGEILNKTSSIHMIYAENAALYDMGLYGQDIIFKDNYLKLVDDTTYYYVSYIYYGTEYQYHITLDTYQVFKKETVKTDEVEAKDKNLVTSNDAISICLTDLGLLGKLDVGEANLSLSETTKESPEAVIRKVMTTLTPKVFLVDADGGEYYWPILWVVVPVYLFLTPICLLISFLVCKFIYKDKTEPKKPRVKREKMAVINDLSMLKPIEDVDDKPEQTKPDEIPKEDETKTTTIEEPKEDNDTPIVENKEEIPIKEEDKNV